MTSLHVFPASADYCILQTNSFGLVNCHIFRPTDRNSDSLEWRVIFSENLLHKIGYPFKDPWLEPLIYLPYLQSRGQYSEQDKRHLFLSEIILYQTTLSISACQSHWKEHGHHLQLMSSRLFSISLSGDQRIFPGARSH